MNVKINDKQANRTTEDKTSDPTFDENKFLTNCLTVAFDEIFRWRKFFAVQYFENWLLVLWEEEVAMITKQELTLKRWPCLSAFFLCGIAHAHTGVNDCKIGLWNDHPATKTGQTSSVWSCTSYRRSSRKAGTHYSERAGHWPTTGLCLFLVSGVSRFVFPWSCGHQHETRPSHFPGLSDLKPRSRTWSTHDIIAELCSPFKLSLWRYWNLASSRVCIKEDYQFARRFLCFVDRAS